MCGRIWWPLSGTGHASEPLRSLWFNRLTETTLDRRTLNPEFLLNQFCLQEKWREFIHFGELWGNRQR
jgi:hypothetical protein